MSRPTPLKSLRSLTSLTLTLTLPPTFPPDKPPPPC